LNGTGTKRLSDMWKASYLRKRFRDSTDNGCPWRSCHPEIIPQGLFLSVHEYLKAKYHADHNVQEFVPPSHYYGTRPTAKAADVAVAASS